MKSIIYIFLFIPFIAFSQQKAEFEGEVYPKDTCKHIDSKIKRIACVDIKKYDKIFKNGCRNGYQIIETDSTTVIVRFFPLGGRYKCFKCSKMVNIEKCGSDTVVIGGFDWKRHPFKYYIKVE